MVYSVDNQYLSSAAAVGIAVSILQNICSVRRADESGTHRGRAILCDYHGNPELVDNRPASKHKRVARCVNNRWDGNFDTDETIIGQRIICWFAT